VVKQLCEYKSMRERVIGAHSLCNLRPWRLLILLSGGGGARDEGGVIRVDVRRLDLNQALSVLRCWAEAFAQEFGHHLY
jgi:hypothetical protein